MIDTKQKSNNGVKINKFSFYKGESNILETTDSHTVDPKDPIIQTQESINMALNTNNLSFLLGSGCSSYVADGKELGISTMGPMAKSFLEKCGQDADSGCLISKKEKELLLTGIGIDIGNEEYSTNLERLLEVLYSAKNVLSSSDNEDLKKINTVVVNSINKIKDFILSKCSKGEFSNGDETVLNIYKNFYQKLIYRDQSLRCPWIFTTNYDVFNELAMDQLNIPYFNGFSGAIERSFNPSVYRYSLAEQLDIANKKWSTVDGFIYLCKLHGSISWEKKGTGISPIKEVYPPNINSSSVMIYPTPLKQNASFSNPYADLFREFHRNIVADQSVLFTIGYSFGDDHINSIIFQALTVPNFKLIAFVALNQKGVIEKLRELNDPRIWIIEGDENGDGNIAYHFETIVNHFMPEPPGKKVDDAIKKVIEEVISSRSDS